MNVSAVAICVRAMSDGKAQGAIPEVKGPAGITHQRPPLGRQTACPAAAPKLIF
jgi:hypothetical protein